MTINIIILLLLIVKMMIISDIYLLEKNISKKPHFLQIENYLWKGGKGDNLK